MTVNGRLPEPVHSTVEFEWLDSTDRIGDGDDEANLDVLRSDGWEGVLSVDFHSILDKHPKEMVELVLLREVVSGRLAPGVELPMEPLDFCTSNVHIGSLPKGCNPGVDNCASVCGDGRAGLAEAEIVA